MDDPFAPLPDYSPFAPLAGPLAAPYGPVSLGSLRRPRWPGPGPFTLPDDLPAGGDFAPLPQVGPAASVQGAPQYELPHAPPDEPGLLGQIGEVLSRPGNAVRGLLAGHPENLLGLIPFSKSLGIYDPHTMHTSGQDINQQYFGIDKSDDFFSGAGLAGIATDVVTDPLSWLPGFMGINGATKAGRAAKLIGGHLGDVDKLAKLKLAALSEVASATEKAALDVVKSPLGYQIFSAGEKFSDPILVGQMAKRSDKIGEAARTLLEENAARGVNTLRPITNAAENVRAGRQAFLGVGGEHDPLGLLRLGGKYNPINWLPKVPLLTAPIELPQYTIAEAPEAAQALQNTWQGLINTKPVKAVRSLFDKTANLAPEAAQAFTQERRGGENALRTGTNVAETQAAAIARNNANLPPVGLGEYDQAAADAAAKVPAAAPPLSEYGPGSVINPQPDQVAGDMPWVSKNKIEEVARKAAAEKAAYEASLESIASEANEAMPLKPVIEKPSGIFATASEENAVAAERERQALLMQADAASTSRARVVDEPLTPRTPDVHAPLSESQAVRAADGSAGLPASNMPVSEIHADPERFQYKQGSGKGGETGSIEGTFKPKEAGSLHVWTDPADGKTYVINGHNRLQAAREAGVTVMPVLHIDAADAAEARAQGAILNLRDNKGTALDAAQFLRDATPATKLEAQDVIGAMKPGIARDGLALSKLDDSIFKQYWNGTLDKERAVMIGEKVADPKNQREIAAQIAKHPKMTQATLSELIDDYQHARTVKTTEKSLFGVDERADNLGLLRAEVIGKVKAELGESYRTLNSMGKAKRAGIIEGAGAGSVDAGRAATAAKGAAETLEDLDRYKQNALSEIFNDAAERIYKDGSKKRAIIAETTEKVRSFLGDPEKIRAYERSSVESGLRESQVVSPDVAAAVKPATFPPATQKSQVVTKTDLLGREYAELEGSSGQGLQEQLFGTENELTPKEIEARKAIEADRVERAAEAARGQGALPWGDAVPEASAAKGPPMGKPAAPTFVEPSKVKIPDGGAVTVEVDPRKLDAALAKRANYVGEGGAGGIDDRYAKAQKFIETGKPVEMPQMSLNKDAPEFRDGRHRFAVLRDMGIERVPISVDAEDAERFKQLYGADTKARAKSLGKTLGIKTADHLYIEPPPLKERLAYMADAKKIASREEQLRKLQTEYEGWVAHKGKGDDWNQKVATQQMKSNMEAQAEVQQKLSALRDKWTTFETQNAQWIDQQKDVAQRIVDRKRGISPPAPVKPSFEEQMKRAFDRQGAQSVRGNTPPFTPKVPEVAIEPADSFGASTPFAKQTPSETIPLKRMGETVQVKAPWRMTRTEWGDLSDTDALKAGVALDAKKAFNIPLNQAKLFSEFYDARAQTWAQHTGKPAAEWYNTRNGGILRGTSPADFYKGLGQVAPDGKVLGLQTMVADGRSIMAGFEGSNLRTAFHEFGHVLEQDLSAPELARANKWLGVTDGKWTPEHSEKFAEAFEQWVDNGQSPTPEMEGIFKKAKRILSTIYAQIKSYIADGKIPDNMQSEMKGTFDRLFGSEQIEELAKPDALHPRYETPGPKWQTAPENAGSAGKSVEQLRAESKAATERLAGMEYGTPEYKAAANEARIAGDKMREAFQRAEFGRNAAKASEENDKFNRYLVKAGRGSVDAAEASRKILPPEASDEIKRRITDAMERGKVSTPEVMAAADNIKAGYTAIYHTEVGKGLEVHELGREGALQYVPHTGTSYSKTFWTKAANDPDTQAKFIEAALEKRKALGLPMDADALKPLEEQRALRAAQAKPIFDKTAKPIDLPESMQGFAKQVYDRLSPETQDWIKRSNAYEEVNKFSQQVATTHESQIPRLRLTSGLSVNELNEVTKAAGAKADVYNIDPAAQYLSRKLRSVRALAGVDFLENTAARVGKVGEWGDKGITIPELDDIRRNTGKPPIFFPDQATADLVQKQYHDMQNPETASGLLKWYDDTTSLFKGYITRMFPAHHVRIHFHNQLLSYFGGVPLNAETGEIANKFLRGSEVAFETPQGVLNAEKIREMSDRLGVTKGGFYDEQLAEQLNKSKKTWNPFKPNNEIIKGGEKLSSMMVNAPDALMAGKPAQILNADSHLLENHDRLRHFLHKLQQGESESAAAESVTHWLGDLSKANMSDFEKDYLSRGVFFYGFTRHVIPKVAEAMAENLAKVNQVAKLATQPGNPEHTPEYAKEGIMLSRGKDKDGNAQLMYDLGTPLEAAVSPFGKSFVQQLNPLLKVPLELGTGRDFFLHKDIKDASKAPHYLDDVDSDSTLGKVLGVEHSNTPFGKKTTMNPIERYAIDASPLSRFSHTASRATDDRKAGFDTLLNLFSGARTVSVDEADETKRAEKAALIKALEEKAREGKAFSFSRFGAGQDADAETKMLLKELRKEKVK